MQQTVKSNSFIAKLDAILKNPSFRDIIALDQPKAKIFIYDKTRLQLEILPFYFRHTHFTSFVRQLNLYGFKTLKKETNFCFTHPVIQQGGQLTAITPKSKLKHDHSHHPPQNPASQTRQYNVSASYSNLSVVSREFQNPNYLFTQVILSKSDVSPQLSVVAPLQSQDLPPNINTCNFYPTPPICFMPTLFGFPWSPFLISRVPPAI